MTWHDWPSSESSKARATSKVTEPRTNQPRLREDAETEPDHLLAELVGFRKEAARRERADSF
jgi:hypothetical protein